MTLVEIGGKRLSCAQWAAELGVTKGAISFRKKKFGETAQEAVAHFYNKASPDMGEKQRLRVRLARAEAVLDAIVSDSFLSTLETVVASIKVVRELREHDKTDTAESKTTEIRRLQKVMRDDNQ